MAACLAALIPVLPASAQDTIHLTWNDCALEQAGAPDLSSDCSSDEGENALYCAFTLASPLDDVLGIEVILDLQHSASGLPDWWEILGEGACRDGALRVSGDFTANGVCVDTWHDLGAGDVTYELAPGGVASRTRIKGNYAVRSDMPRTVTAGEMHYGLKILIDNRNTVSASFCSGCEDGACLVLNSIKLLRGPGSPPQDPLVVPGSGNGNRVTWRGGAGADCLAVPAKNRTWGQIKSLYR